MIKNLSTAIYSLEFLFFCQFLDFFTKFRNSEGVRKSLNTIDSLYLELTRDQKICLR